jgi:hypothetical protein
LDRWCESVAYLHAPRTHGLGNILQSLRPHIVEGDINLAANLSICVFGDADPAWFSDPFKPHRNIDPVTKDIVLFDNDITM